MPARQYPNASKPVLIRISTLCDTVMQMCFRLGGVFAKSLILLPEPRVAERGGFEPPKGFWHALPSIMPYFMRC